MSKEYDAMVTDAAQAMEKAMHKCWDFTMPTVCVIPTTDKEDGRIVIVTPREEVPEGAIIVRPSDNAASAHRSWVSVPFDHIRHVLWHALRSQPILPIPRNANEKAA